MAGTVFIIDPAYTLPLLVGFVAAWRLKERRAARSFLLAGVVLSTAYLGWSVAALLPIP
jgi:inner membrane protein